MYFLYLQLYDTNQGAQVPVFFLHPMPPTPEGFCLWQVRRGDHGILDFRLGPASGHGFPIGNSLKSPHTRDSIKTLGFQAHHIFRLGRLPSPFNLELLVKECR